MPDVLIVLRCELEAARRDGVSFDDAWPVAREHALKHASSQADRVNWSLALWGTRHTWSACFYDVPSRVGALVDMVARE